MQMDNTFKFNHVSIIVPDLKQAIKFYMEYFGMEVFIETYNRKEQELKRVWNTPNLHVNLAMLKGSCLRIELIEDHVTFQTQQKRYPSPHISFEVNDTQTVYENLVEKGIVFINKPEIIRNSVKIAFFLGPGDIVHEIIQIMGK
ncbi:hypothetical protein BK142_03660 [Paenibacillus glucanolyticus]|nr:hypothetical protein BK142_03660 [Paenibacillus glucanolyticus]